MTRASTLPLLPALLAALALALGCGEDDPNDQNGDPNGQNGDPNGEDPCLPPSDSISQLRSELVRENPTGNDEDLQSLIADHTSFALWMYQQGLDASDPDDNFIFSPLSISTAFGMLWPGALGETADEIASMLHFRLGPDLFHPAANRLDRELTSRGDYEPTEEEGEAPILEIVNDIWGLDDYPYVQEYLDLLALHYGAGMWIVDFVNASEEAREAINEYIAEQTRQLVPELLPAGSIDSDTRLVLTNAIYFKGAWRYPFSEEATSDAPFSAIDGTVTDVPMMSGDVEEAFYARLDGAEAVELPYVGNDLSMVLILPDEGTFESFEAALDEVELEYVMSSLEPAGGSLSMPRFEFDAELDLVEIFKDAGYHRPFSSGADLRGLSEMALADDLHVTGAFHKAAIALDEEGTEAAAATAIVVGRDSAPGNVFNMRLDRPFLFVIRDKPTGAILFMGRMADAGKAQG